MASEPSPPEPRTKMWRWLDASHLGLALTLSYLFLATIGMLHRALVFYRFRVNLFDFAEPADFVLAALRDPFIVLWTVLPIPLVWLYFRFAGMLRTRTKPSKWFNSPKQRELAIRYQKPLFYSTVVLWATASLLNYAKRVSAELRAGEGRRIQVELIADNGQGTTPIPRDSAVVRGDTTAHLLLGTTQKFVFLYDPAAQRTTIIPMSNIARMKIQSPKRRRAGQ